MSLLHGVLLVLIAVPTLLIASFPLHAALAFRRSRRALPPPSSGRSLSVIVPVRGVDEDAATNIGRLVEQIVDGTVEIIYCVEEETDPIVPLLRSIGASIPPGRLRIVVAGPSGPSLGKIHNLSAGLRAAQGEWLVFMDSDVRLPHGQYLAQFVRALEAPNVGLVTCYPAYREARTVAAALLGATINHDLLGYFAMEAIWRRLSLANGSCMAVRREVIEAIGGLADLRRSLLMDSILARRITEAGYSVHLHPEPAPVVRQLASMREWWAQAHRWQVAMSRVLSPATYAGFCWMRSGLLLALVLLLAAGAGPVSLSALGAVLTARVVSARLLGALYTRDDSQVRYLWLLPAVELLNAVGCLYAIIDRRVTWRGKRYRVGPGGAVLEYATGAAVP